MRCRNNFAMYFSFFAFHIIKLIYSDDKMSPMTLMSHLCSGNNSYSQLTIFNKRIEEIKPFTHIYMNGPSRLPI